MMSSCITKFLTIALDVKKKSVGSILPNLLINANKPFGNFFEGKTMSFLSVFTIYFWDVKFHKLLCI